MTTIAFTGARPNKLRNEYSGIGPVSDWIRKETKKNLLKLQPELIYDGMAQGFDMLAAEICIELGIPFVAAVPFVGQEGLWPEDSQKRYFSILEKAKKIVIVSEGGYSAQKMEIRNRFMVDNSSTVIALLINPTGGRSGTQNCVDYAKSKGKKIIYLPIMESGVL